jgi:hypothetical protein
MTISVAAVGNPRFARSQRKTVTDVTLDSSYPTGGETVTATQLGLAIIEDAVADVKTVSGTVNIANVFCNISSTGASLLLVVYDETPAEVTDTASLASVVVRVTAWGRGMS